MISKNKNKKPLRRGLLTFNLFQSTTEWAVIVVLMLVVVVALVIPLLFDPKNIFFKNRLWKKRKEKKELKIPLRCG